MEDMKKIKEFVVNYKNIIIIVLVALLALFIFWDSLPFGGGKNAAESVALKFTEAMYKGDAEKCVSLMCDDLIELSGYETEKLFINAFDNECDSIIDICKDIYGDDWKYEVSVIDSFEYTPPYDCDEELVKVVLKIEHKGVVWFNEKEGDEEMGLIMVKRDGKWLVYDFN